MTEKGEWSDCRGRDTRRYAGFAIHHLAGKGEDVWHSPLDDALLSGAGVSSLASGH